MRQEQAGSAEPESPRVGEDEGRRALLVAGVVQSVAVDSGDVAGYWSALLPAVRPRRALVLGLGGGTLVHLLRRRFGELAVVGVDDDSEVLALGRAAFSLEVPRLEIVEQDAVAYVATCRERFDYICVDLYRGSELERRSLGRPFLRGLRALATPGAEIVLNLFQDRRAARRLQRIARVLTIRSADVVGKNLVVRAGAR